MLEVRKEIEFAESVTAEIWGGQPRATEQVDPQDKAVAPVADSQVAIPDINLLDKLCIIAGLDSKDSVMDIDRHNVFYKAIEKDKVARKDREALAMVKRAWIVITRGGPIHRPRIEKMEWEYIARMGHTTEDVTRDKVDRAYKMVIEYKNRTMPDPKPTIKHILPPTPSPEPGLLRLIDDIDTSCPYSGTGQPTEHDDDADLREALTKEKLETAFIEAKIAELSLVYEELAEVERVLEVAAVLTELKETVATELEAETVEPPQEMGQEEVAALLEDSPEMDIVEAQAVEEIATEQAEVAAVLTDLTEAVATELEAEAAEPLQEIGQEEVAALLEDNPEMDIVEPQAVEEMATEQVEPAAQSSSTARKAPTDKPPKSSTARKAPTDRPPKRPKRALRPCNNDLSYMWGIKGEHRVRLGVSKELGKLEHIESHRDQRGFLKLSVKFELAPDYKPYQTGNTSE